MFEYIAFTGVGVVAIVILGIISLVFKCYHQVSQGTALIRNGMGGQKVSFGGMVVVPVLHRVELMDLSVKTVEIDRHGAEGLICKDNLRADVKVRFFVRVNNTDKDVLKVAQSLGCRRASDMNALVELFDAKFSEALKTVGKKFNFVELYTERKRFKDEIIDTIGTDLNGYVLEDAAIDYLEQTPIEKLNPNNILDCEGIKKISEITAQQLTLANQIQREKEMTIEQQNVKARETILELQRQQAEAEERQKREIAATKARQEAEAQKIQSEERLKAERARIQTEEEIAIAEENRMRQIIVAAKNKERAQQVETERVEKDRALEQTERERIVSLAQIEKTKAIEIEQKNIQEVIRQRMIVQRATAEEEQRIYDVQEIAKAEREKKVQVVKAEMEAEQALIADVKKAEANRRAAEFAAAQTEVEWEAQRKAAEKEMEVKKMLALAKQAEVAAQGLAEAQVMETKAVALEKQGTAEAVVLERKAIAEAKGIEAKAAALEKQGGVEARVLEVKAVAEAKAVQVKAEAREKEGAIEAKVLEMKYTAEAKGIEAKANSMKLLDSAGRDHEEFKLRLAQQKEIELARIEANQHIAQYQRDVLSSALQSARIDIVGGDQSFFDKITSSVAAGKALDRMVDNSQTLAAVRDTFLTGDPETFKLRLKKAVSLFGATTEDVKNLSVAALLGKMLVNAPDKEAQDMVRNLMDHASSLGLSEKVVAAVLPAPTPSVPTGKSGK